MTEARAQIAAGKAADALAALQAAEERLGEDADLLIAEARAFLSLAEDALSSGAGDKFLVKGFVADAHVRWKRATTADAGVPGAAAVRAQILRFEENPDEARATLDAHLAADPDDAEAHAVRGEMAVAARDWAAADAHWSRAADLDPKDGRARLQATIAKQWRGVQAAKLEEGYLAAALLLPDDPEALRLLTNLHARDRDRKLALLAQVSAAAPSAAWPRIWTAHILRTEGTPDLARARAALEEAAKVAPKNPAVHFNLGLVLEDAKAPLEAVSAYLACVEASRENDCAQASDALDRLLHDPASPVAQSVPLSLRTRCVEAVIARNPNDGRYGNNAGLWFRDVGKDYEASLRWYLASVAAAPDDQDFLNDCALIYLFHLTDRLERCLPMFEKVVALVEEEGQEPVRGYWDALENLCKYWFDKGEYAKVVELAKKRADPRATAFGQPYPSLRAAAYGVQAQKRLK